MEVPAISIDTCHLRSLLLEKRRDSEFVSLYWTQLTITIVTLNNAGRGLIPVALAISLAHTILSAGAIIKLNDVPNVPTLQLYFVISTNLLAGSCMWFTMLRFCEAIYDETEELRSKIALMRRGKDSWKGRSLQRIVGNRIRGMPLAIRRGDLGIIEDGITTEFFQIVIDNVISFIFLVNMNVPFVLLSNKEPL